MIRSHYQHLDEVMVGAVGLQLGQPVLHLVEALPGGHVIDQDGALPVSVVRTEVSNTGAGSHLSSSVVAGGQRAEPLLARRVPDGQLHAVTLLVHHLHLQMY